MRSAVPDGPEPVEPAQRLFDLARAGAVEQLRAYVDGGGPADLHDRHGNTLLMLAAYHGHAGAVRVLIDHGATVDRVNDRGQTPLSGAVFKAYLDVAEVLVAAGADPYAGTPSPMDTATYFGHEDLHALLTRGR